MRGLDRTEQWGRWESNPDQQIKSLQPDLRATPPSLDCRANRVGIRRRSWQVNAICIHLSDVHCVDPSGMWAPRLGARLQAAFCTYHGLAMAPRKKLAEYDRKRSFAKTPDYFDPENIVRLAIEGGCNAVASTFGVLGIVARRYAHTVAFIHNFRRRARRRASSSPS